MRKINRNSIRIWMSIFTMNHLMTNNTHHSMMILCNTNKMIIAMKRTHDEQDIRIFKIN